MDKNRKFTVTWNELESLVEGLVTEQLHKYGILESFYDSSEDEQSDDFEYELRTLIDLYEDGEIYDDSDEDSDYYYRQNIRHYKRGQIDFDLRELYNDLKALADKLGVNYKRDSELINGISKSELDDLIKQWENGDIYTDDYDEDYTVNQYIRHYKRGVIDFDIKKLYDMLANAD